MPTQPMEFSRVTAATTPDAAYTPPPPRQPLKRGMAQGPLIVQPKEAARLAHILYNASFDLQDVCALDDPPQMWEEARAIASRILAACPVG